MVSRLGRMVSMGLLALVLALGSARAQLSSSIFARLSAADYGTGQITLHGPNGLQEAILQAAQQHRKKPSIPGYRIRLYRGLGRNARSDSERIQAQVKALPLELRVYMAYDAPYYTVAVGDCRTRLEALHLQQLLLPQFPQAFAIADQVAMPPLCNDRRPMAPQAAGE